MTESDWQDCVTDSMLMLRMIREKESDRKRRLFAVACCQHVWHLLRDERSQKAVRVAEQFAEGIATKEELQAACAAAWEAVEVMDDAARRAEKLGEDQARAMWSEDMAARAASFSAEIEFPEFATVAAEARILQYLPQLGRSSAEDQEQESLCRLVREIFGNPFRPVSFNQAWGTPAAIRLAQGIYDGRTFDRLGILANVLEEAGCTNQDILHHCRQLDEHVKGCWALDLILGKK
jgi:hypothetical protein